MIFRQALNSLNKYCEIKLLKATKHNTVNFLTVIPLWLVSKGWGGRASLPINMMDEEGSEIFTVDKIVTVARALFNHCDSIIPFH